MANNQQLKSQCKHAEKLFSAGKLAAAGQAYFKLCQQHPAELALWLRAGEIAKQLQHLNDASYCYQQALRLNPNQGELYFELAQMALMLGRYHQAEQNFRSCLMLKPDWSDAYAAYARLLHDWGRPQEAIENYQKAITNTQTSAQLAIELSLLLQRQGRFDEALLTLAQAERQQADNPNIYNYRGCIYRDMNLPEQAKQNFERALLLAPENKAVYHYYLGTLHKSLGDNAQALQQYEQAITLKAQFAEAHFERGLCLLLGGDYERGWQEYEWRFRHPDWIRQRHLSVSSLPLWNGAAMPDKTILVIAEQGYGDSFQFCRYLTLLAKQFATLIVYCKSEIAALIASVGGVSRVISNQAELATTPFHTYVYMMSLPYHFKTRLDNIPFNQDYLHAPATLVENWRRRLNSDKLKVGLAWKGSPANAIDLSRRIDLAMLAPLANIEAVEFFGLQIGPGSEEALTPPAGMNFTNLAPEITHFSDTAAIIQNLDLMISIDSALAHLTGALGKPIWVLLHTPPEWRYLLDRDDSPWYASMRLFRQRQKGDWSDVIQQVHEALKKMAEAVNTTHG